MRTSIDQWHNDVKFTKEGCEYNPAYWSLVVAYRRMAELEREWEVGMLQEERREFIRRVKDNDKPGKRHMLPFVWVRRTGFDGQVTDIKLPLKEGTPHYKRALDKINAKIKAARGE